jgi:hypothetical protein
MVSSPNPVKNKDLRQTLMNIPKAPYLPDGPR